MNRSGLKGDMHGDDVAVARLVMFIIIACAIVTALSS